MIYLLTIFQTSSVRVYMSKGTTIYHCKERVEERILTEVGDTSGRYIRIEISEEEYERNRAINQGEWVYRIV